MVMRLVNSSLWMYISPNAIWPFMENSYSNTIFVCCFGLIHSTVSAQCRLNLFVHSDLFSASAVYILVSTIPCTLGPALFVGFYLPLILLGLFIMFIFWMFHVHTINFPINLVLGSSPPILAISINLFLWFLDAAVFKVGNYFNITRVGIPSFSVSMGLGYVFSPL